jgi:hypothetical protein
MTKFSEHWYVTRHLFSYVIIITLSPVKFAYSITPWSSAILEKSLTVQLLKFPTIFWNSTVHYGVHKSSPLVLPWVRSTQFIPPYPTSLRYLLISSSHLGLGLPSGLFPSGFPTKILHTFLFARIHATFPAHLTLLDLIILIILCEASPNWITGFLEVYK